jgi:hypothetical protein
MTNKTTEADFSATLRNDKQKKLQGRKYVGERFGRQRLEGVHRGSSRSKDALRMTNKTTEADSSPFASLRVRNDKQKQIPFGNDKQEGNPPIAMRPRWMGHPVSGEDGARGEVTVQAIRALA